MLFGAFDDKDLAKFRKIMAYEDVKPDSMKWVADNVMAGSRITMSSRDPSDVPTTMHIIAIVDDGWAIFKRYIRKVDTWIVGSERLEQFGLWYQDNLLSVSTAPAHTAKIATFAEYVSPYLKSGTDGSHKYVVRVKSVANKMIYDAVVESRDFESNGHAGKDRKRLAGSDHVQQEKGTIYQHISLKELRVDPPEPRSE